MADHTMRQQRDPGNAAFHIRPGREDDVPAILGLVRDLARFENAEHEVRATEEDLRRDGWGPAPKFEVLVAEPVLPGARGLIGLLLFFTTYSTWEGRPGLFVEDIFVVDTARGQGVGRALMAELAAVAESRGCARIELSVLDWNPARAFYARLGFEPLTEWLRYRMRGPALGTLAARPAQARAAQD